VSPTSTDFFNRMPSTSAAIIAIEARDRRYRGCRDNDGGAVLVDVAGALDSRRLLNQKPERYRGLIGPSGICNADGLCRGNRIGIADVDKGRPMPPGAILAGVLFAQ